MAANNKVAKRGDVIFKEGDKISSLILIQSGTAVMCLIRPKKNIELYPVGPSQITGEQAFNGTQTHGYSLVANSEVRYMEIPIEAPRAQVEAAPQFLKMVIKSLTDRLRVITTDLKGAKMDKDTTPLPEDQVAKVFGSLYHCVLHKGKVEDERKPHILTIEWVQMKQYCQRIFGESPRRMEQACTLLVKLKMATFTMGKAIDAPEGPDEIQQFNLMDLPALESFFEFYQYYYFKGGAASVLKYEETMANILQLFLNFAESLTPDRFGAVAMEFPKVVDFFKADANIALNNGHFVQFETKGLFAKRQTRSDGTVMLSFDLKEWQNTLKIWRIVSEIDKWNEKGFVDLNEPTTKAKKKAGGPTCPSCAADLLANAKFCQECGAKIEAAKVA